MEIEDETVENDFPRDLFWPALKIYRVMTNHAQIHGVNFAESLKWIFEIHSRHFSALSLEDLLPIFQILFVERSYTLSDRICPIHQIFCALAITPSEYLPFKNTLILTNNWPSSNEQAIKRVTPHLIFSQYFKKCVSIDRKAHILIIHTKQYETIATLRDLRNCLKNLHSSGDVHLSENPSAS